MMYCVSVVDALFGKRTLLEFPSPDGTARRIKVTERWLGDVAHQGKLHPAEGVLVIAHVIDPTALARLMVETAKEVIAVTSARKLKLYLPVDFLVADRFESTAETRVVPLKEIPDGWSAVDIGPASAMLFKEILWDAKTIVWNGPMGAFEIPPFAAGTNAIVHALATSPAVTIVGGVNPDCQRSNIPRYARVWNWLFPPNTH